MKISSMLNDQNEYPVEKEDILPIESDTKYNLYYPEIFYKIQPYVMSVCDQMDTDGCASLTQDAFDQISDRILGDVVTTYPDLGGYANYYKESAVETMQRDYDKDYGVQRDRGYDRDYGDWDRRDRDYDRDRMGRYFPNYRFRRRGLFRDFIDLLLLNELVRRGIYNPYLPYYNY